MWWRPLAFLPNGEQELLFFWLEPWPTARSHVGVLGSLRVLATSRLRLPVHVPAVSPRELTGTAALQRGIPPVARGGIQILGMVMWMLEDEDLLQSSSDGVDYERWSAHSLRLREEWWER